ncbi:hypothetical protein OEZ86_001939 [Tetradesmus obliquus]|nr:hypothetical protein OEZ86_001939 [Tetradesmus obliquus]
MSVTRLNSGAGSRISTDRTRQTARPFSSNSSLSRLPQLAIRSTSSSSMHLQQTDHLALLKQLLGSAVDRVLGSSKAAPAAADIGRPCPVTYTESSSSSFTPMSKAARLAFAALERDDELEQQAALGALCLVTYSDDEDTSSSMAFPASNGSATNSAAATRAVRAFAALNALQDGGRCDAVSSEDADLAGGVMDTLCIVTYDDEDKQ